MSLYNSLRAWAMRTFDLSTGEYCRSIQDRYNKQIEETYSYESKIREMTAHIDVLEQDRLNCRSEHWRLALSLSSQSLHKAVLDNLALAVIAADAETNAVVHHAMDSWRDLSVKNEAKK